MAATNCMVLNFPQSTKAVERRIEVFVHILTSPGKATIKAVAVEPARPAIDVAATNI